MSTKINIWCVIRIFLLMVASTAHYNINPKANLDLCDDLHILVTLSLSIYIMYYVSNTHIGIFVNQEVLTPTAECSFIKQISRPIPHWETVENWCDVLTQQRDTENAMHTNFSSCCQLFEIKWHLWILGEQTNIKKLINLLAPKYFDEWD